MRLILLTVAFALAGAATAQACSCLPAPKDPDAEIAQSAAAVHGKIVTRDGRPRKGVTYRLRVLEDFKGNAGRVLRFVVPRSSCAFSAKKGKRISLLLSRFKGDFSAGLCSIRSRAYLRRAAGASAVRTACSASSFGR